MNHPDKPFIAHWRKTDGSNYEIVLNENNEPEKVEIQTITEHLHNTSELAAKFAAVFDAEEYGAQIGLMHDLGKFSDGFQKRIWENKHKVDHSSAGAIEAIKVDGMNAIGFTAAYCISGHHAGLMNGGAQMDNSDTCRSVWARLNKNLDEDYLCYSNEITLSKIINRPQLKMLSSDSSNMGVFSLFFWIRMLFSCLVDADYLDTELFSNYGKTNRDSGESFDSLLKKLNARIAERGWTQGAEGINKLRSGILNDCINQGKQSKGGAYTLTVPTGGGKTIASLAFSLNQVVSLNKKRIIYVIPYCSIIDQTVDVFSEILGKNNVLAHYSAADVPENQTDDDAVTCSQKLATENWDKPVIVTTAVQFFESLFANRTSQCRKLHNIADSVIIFDEAQTLPQPYLKPCIAAIMELIQNYKCSTIFCTATQPALNRFFEKYNVNHKPFTLPITEICSNTEDLYKAFKRVTYKKLGKLKDSELASRLMNEEQVLCIVSTRKHAYNLFQLMEGDGNFHLSKCMTSKHIKETIDKIRTRLKNGETCRVISTSLVEAGVDLDFKTVYRSNAGLDSIIQAGGRCNREGKYAAADSIVYIFEPEDKYLMHFPDVLKRPASITDVVTKDVDDIADGKIVKRFFNNLFNHLDGDTAEISDGLDIRHIMHRIEDCQKLSFPFADIARDFKIIENNTFSVFVPSDDTSNKLAEKLQNAKEYMTKEEYRTIGKYCVNVYPQNLKAIQKSIIILDDSFGILAVEKLYDQQTGLKFEDEGGLGLFS